MSKTKKMNLRCLKVVIIIIIIIKRTGCGKERSPESRHEDGPLQDTWPGSKKSLCGKWS